jgi:sortase A
VRAARRLARWAVGLLGDAFLTAGVGLLLFVGWQLWWTDVTATRAQHADVVVLDREFGAAATSGPSTSRTDPGAPRLGKGFAILRIPRFGSDYARPLLEGTTHDILMAGVGHYQGTAAPGTVGNFAIAGHRTTYGRPFHDIDTLRPGDRIVVETRATFHVYAVKRHTNVSPAEGDVVAPVPEHPGARPTQRWLTMTACHPKYSAAQRYVVFAELVASYPRGEGLPEGILAPPGPGS